ncbi:MAG: cytochrome c [Gemmatimonadales bacterium]
MSRYAATGVLALLASGAPTGRDPTVATPAESRARSRASSARGLAGAVAMTIAGALGAVACEEESQQAVGMTPEAMVALSADASLPDSLLAGRAVFETYCRECHGQAATGTQKGPPLVHRVYHPGHHADPAFYLAPLTGVRAHHWGFGDMPPVEGITRDEVGTIVAYVRWLQRKAGIF